MLTLILLVLLFFKRRQAKNKEHLGKLSAYFSTHPLTEERIELLHQVATAKGWQMTGEITDLSDLLSIE